MKGSDRWIVFGNGAWPRHRGKNVLFSVAVVVFVALRIFLQSGLPVFARPASVEDDMLMVFHADSLRNGKWLGEYDVRTLGKPPGCGMFLAVLDDLGCPFMVGTAIVWCFSSLLFLWALRQWENDRRILLAAFVFILFSPAMSGATAQRIYCLALVPPTILALVSSYFGLLSTPRLNGKTISFLACAAISLSFYSILRPDAIWVFFSAGLLSLIAVLGHSLRGNVQSSRKTPMPALLLFLAIPFLCAGSTRRCVSAMNERIYGIRTNGDFTETGFAAMCKSLMRIRPEKEIPFVYVTRGAWENACLASPALGKIRKRLDARYANSQAPGMMSNGEWEREFYAWNLRWAASESGIYAKGAKAADEFFGTVSDEIERALADGTLPRRKAAMLSPFTGPMTVGRFFRIIRHSLRSLAPHVFGYALLPPKLALADIRQFSTTKKNFLLMQDVANQELATSEWPRKPHRSGDLRRFARFVRTGDAVCRPFRTTGKAVAFIALATLVAVPFRIRRLPAESRDKTLFLSLFGVGLLLSAWAGLFLVSANFFEVDQASHEWSIRNYIVGTVPVWQLFVAISFLLTRKLFSASAKGPGETIAESRSVVASAP